jgi:hypothetical protein
MSLDLSEAPVGPLGMFYPVVDKTVATAMFMRIILSGGNVNIRSDRALLCAQSAPVAGDGDQLAELWQWVSAKVLIKTAVKTKPR